MAKGYWIVRVTVRDQDHYPEYLAAAQLAFEKHDAKFLVRGGNFDTMEGSARERNVVVEFADCATAIACYRSPEYQAARSLRQKYAESDFIIIEGAAATAKARGRAALSSTNSQNTIRRTALLRRIFDALMRARERRAEFYLGRQLRNSGGRLTDDIERRMMQQATRIGNIWF